MLLHLYHATIVPPDVQQQDSPLCADNPAFPRRGPKAGGWIGSTSCQDDYCRLWRRTCNCGVWEIEWSRSQQSKALLRSGRHFANRGYSLNCNKLVLAWPLRHLADLSPSGASRPRVINQLAPLWSCDNYCLCKRGGGLSGMCGWVQDRVSDHGKEKATVKVHVWGRFLIWMASTVLLCQNPSACLWTVTPSQLMQWSEHELQCHPWGLLVSLLICAHLVWLSVSSLFH